MCSLRQTIEAVQLHMVLYQWGRREQALQEEINVQTSISSNRMVNINLLLMKPTLNSSISSFNCPLLQPAFSDVGNKMVLLNYTKALPKEHLCVQTKPLGLGKVMKQPE